MIYSELESELDSNFAINLVSDFDSASESDSDSSSVVINLDICIFFLFNSCTLLIKLAGSFFIHSHNRINSYASNAIILQIMQRSFGTSSPKKFALILLSNSLTLAFMYVSS